MIEHQPFSRYFTQSGDFCCACKFPAARRITFGCAGKVFLVNDLIPGHKIKIALDLYLVSWVVLGWLSRLARIVRRFFVFTTQSVLRFSDEFIFRSSYDFVQKLSLDKAGAE